MLYVKNMIVIVTAGKNAGKKAVVVKVLDTRHCIVAGISRMPKQSEDFCSKQEKRKNDKTVVFVKKYNVHHLLATRYKADIGLKEDMAEALSSRETKNNVKKEIATTMLKAKENNKARFLFSELKIN